MKKVVITLIILIGICSLFKAIYNNDVVTEYTENIQQLKTMNSSGIYGDYIVDSNSIMYIADNTTVSEFIEKIKIDESDVKILNKENKKMLNEELITTSTKVIVTTNEEDTIYTVVVPGDVDQNGKADIKDILSVNKHRLGKIELKNEQFLAGDVDYNGEVNIKDLLKLNKYRLEKIDSLLPERIEIEQITLNTYNIQIEEGNNYKLEALIMPENATNKELEYISSDEEIAIVDKKGTITGLKEGNCTVLVQSENGVSAECEVNVTKQSIPTVPVESIELSNTNLNLEIEDIEKIEATIKPDDASNKKLIWSSSNPNVVTVDGEGKITAISEGEAEITATTTDGSNITATAKVKVTVNVKEIILNTEQLNVNIGESPKLEVTINPGNATNKGITWTSSNENIATVDEEGTVRGVEKGECTITVESENGIKAECKVVVQNPLPDEVKVRELKLNTTEIEINKGNTQKIEATINPENATNKQLTWISSNTNVVTVDGEGNIIARGRGTAYVTAKTTDGSNITETVTINVKVPVEGVKLTPENISLKKEENQKIYVTITPNDATNKAIEWTSSNTNVATVDNNGIVTAKEKGEAEITAKTIDGSNITVTAKVQVTEEVKPIEVTSIILNTNNISLNKEESKTIEATVVPSNASNKTIEWTSSDTEVATVDGNGKITGVANGETQITLTATDGSNVSATIDVKVITPVESISLEKTETVLDLSGTKEEQLVATVTPEEATEKTVTWTSSDERIATVDSNGKVTGIANGEATITAKTTNGKTSSCKVTVETGATGITLNKTSSTIDLSGIKTLQLTGTIAPTTTTNKTITWTSSNTEVATVDNNGKIEAKSNGTAIITAKTVNGKTATCKITVQTSPTGITLNKTSATLDLGGTKTLQLTSTITPITSNISNTITWTSSNTKVATVSNKGLIIGVANGTATITAKTSNGKTATCKITVQTSPTGIKLDKTATTLDLSGTKTAQLTATITPSTANVNTAITWKSGNTKIATVSSTGKVTGVANGVATITATTANGKTATCKVTVQTTATGIYFETNASDKTKYEKVKKGETKVIKAKLKPETANIGTNITYSLSGNSKVASVNSSTGKITAKQAGVMTLTAQLENGKKASIMVNVNIGNTAVTQSALTSTANDSIYSKTVVPYKSGDNPAHMQSFDIDSEGEILYGVTEMPSAPIDKTYISKFYIATGKSTRPTDYGMKILYGGHEGAIDLEEVGSSRYIWGTSFASVNGNYGFVANYCISRIKYQDNKTIYYGPGTVTEKDKNKNTIKTYKNISADNFVHVNSEGNMNRNLNASIDEDNRLLCMYNKSDTTVYMKIYDLDEALALPDEKFTDIKITTYVDPTKSSDKTTKYLDFTAKNLGYKKLSNGTYKENIVPLAVVKVDLNKETNFLNGGQQGFDLDGDYIYVVEGGSVPTCITAFDYMYNYNGNKKLFDKTTVAASYTKEFYEKMGNSKTKTNNGKNFYETEGIKVKNGIVYCGYMAKLNDSKRSSILQIK